MENTEKKYLYEYGSFILKDTFCRSINIIDKDFKNQKIKIDTIDIPDGVRTIDSFSLNNYELKTVNLPESVNAILDYGLNNDYIENVNMPKNISHIGRFAFGLSRNLKNIVIPEGIKTFYNSSIILCDKIPYIVLPESLKTFRVDTEITDKHIYILKNKNTKIKYDVPEKSRRFLGNLKLIIADDLKKYSEDFYSFSKNYNSLFSFLSKEDLKKFMNNKLYDKLYSDKNKNIDGLVYNTDNELLYSINSDKNIVIRDNTTFINRCALSCNNDIETINASKICSLDSECFENIKNLNTVLLNNDIDLIPDSCFKNNKKLKNINFPKGLKYIQKAAFSNCNLNNIILPEGIKIIDEFAFQNNENVECITIPDTIEYINQGAFEGCSDNIIFNKDDGNIKVRCFVDLTRDKMTNNPYWNLHLNSIILYDAKNVLYKKSETIEDFIENYEYYFSALPYEKIFDYINPDIRNDVGLKVFLELNKE